jgi:glycosyltransferase involved in cell wall biosynthesis
VADQVRILGFVPRQEVHPILAGATALAYPSRFEGFGLPLLEAMYLGVPVVSSRAASLPEVAGDAALLVEPDNVDGWVNALDSVTRDNALRQRLIEAGLVNVRRFSWDRCATATLEVLRRATSSR